MLNLIDLKVRNFKCFGEKLEGFDNLKPINIIIGRNNSGKSSLIDIIYYVSTGEFDIPRSQWNDKTQPEIVGTVPITDSIAGSVFQKHVSGGGIPGSSHYEFGKQLIGMHLTYRLNEKPQNSFVNLTHSDGRPDDILSQLRQDLANYQQKLVANCSNPLRTKTFKLIAAERDIISEVENDAAISIGSDGSGVTDAIQRFINSADLPSDLVERTILYDLNEIFEPDSTFIDIVCQKLSSGQWEIYLHEEQKGRIPLSQSGSGLKTILMLLSYIHLVPYLEDKSLRDIILAAEELENNLHPSLLRRLLSYITRKQEETGLFIFLTTHSNIAIDFFNKNEDAQIVHVQHDGQNATAYPAKTYIENRGILDDLDVRASDILQSNGIVWVEGPSDRIYVNRWISLWSKNRLKEGTHYHCVFYGGRLLSHLSSAEPEAVDDAISILRINRNAIILMDSDKRAQQTPINETKRRVEQEAKDLNGFAWITKGREVENYIPTNSIRRWLNNENTIARCGRYQSFFEYLDTLRTNLGSYYSSRKPLLAEEVCPFISTEDIESTEDLGEQLTKTCRLIETWNK